ncbi:MAG: hypothetical protein JWQ98_496 [Chlorobi bacterium]|nr:hypothetical protein [Chlorobiota bacterium]
MASEIIFTESAPLPIGPYSQAVRAGGFLFTAGQIPLKNGALVDGDVGDQARQAILNLQAILEAGGASLATVVKTTIFLLDMEDFGAVNAVYAEYFGNNSPARSTVQVSRLPKDARVEIEAIAIAE